MSNSLLDIKKVGDVSIYLLREEHDIKVSNSEMYFFLEDYVETQMIDKYDFYERIILPHFKKEEKLKQIKKL